jgi:hypothetical protein
LSALLLLFGAKVLGTAVVARLFQLTEPALMRIPLFARWYPRWKSWKDGVLMRVRESGGWRLLQGLKRRLRRSWKRLRQR